MTLDVDSWPPQAHAHTHLLNTHTYTSKYTYAPKHIQRKEETTMLYKYMSPSHKYSGDQKMINIGAVEMAQQLGLWLLLQMAPVQFPAHTWLFIITCNSGFRGSDALFWPPLALNVHTVHRHTCTQNIHTHKIIFEDVKHQKCIL